MAVFHRGGTLSLLRRRFFFREEDDKPKQSVAGYRKKAKDTKSSAADQQKQFDKKMEEWKRFAQLLIPPIVRPERTEEELIEAHRMVNMYKKKRLQVDRAFHINETLLIRKRKLAIEEIPPQLREAACKNDDTPLPLEFIWPRINPPLEGEELFGQAQHLGRVKTVGDFGGMPFPRKPRRR